MLLRGGVTPSSAILACGHRLGPYELLAPLAHGGMGAVWAARDRRSGAIVAVKTMARIIEAVEQQTVAAPPLTHRPRTQGGVISFAARDIAERVGATALIAFTSSGDTVRRMARGSRPTAAQCASSTADLWVQVATSPSPFQASA